MMKTIPILIVVLGAVALLLGKGSPALAADVASANINAPTEVAGGSDFSVSVDISDVSALDAGQFDVSFDEALIRLDNVTAGEIGGTEIPVDLWNKMGTGNYRVIVNVPGVPGVSGSGTLAVLHFHVPESTYGSSEVSLANGFLNDNLGTEIAATWTGDSVSVGVTPGTTDPSVDPSGAIDDGSPASGAAQETVFRWWVLSVIIGAAVVLIAAVVTGVLFRRHQMAKAMQASGDVPKTPGER